MSNEFVHASQGTTLTQAEFEAVGLHVCNSQATGDLIYASSATQLSRLAIGSGVLVVSGGIPAWSTTLPAVTLGGAITGGSQNISGVGTFGCGAITATGLTITSQVIQGDGTWAFQKAYTVSTGGNNLLTLTGGSAGVQLGNTIGVGVAPETTSIGLFASTGTSLASFRCAGSSPVFQIQRCNNTLASPTDAANGNATGIISFQAYSGGWLGTASVQAYVDGTFVSGQRPPSALYFYTNLANTSAAARLGINGAGAVIVGNAGVPFATQVAGSLGVTAGVMIGANSLNNLIDDASGGAGSTAMYIGNAQITAVSDVRLKKDICNTERNALGILRMMRVVDFTWNDPSDTNPHGKNSRGRYTGMVAQETVGLAPWIINAPDRDCPDCLVGNPCSKHTSPWFVEYDHLVPLMVKGIQDLEKRLAALEV